MKKILSVVFCYFCFFIGVHSQPIAAKYHEKFDDAEFFFMSEMYKEALFQYTILLKNGYSENANINYRVGLCYLNTPGQKQKAIPYLEKAAKDVTVEYEEGSYDETKCPYAVFYFLGQVYKQTEQFEQAVVFYQKYIDSDTKINSFYKQIAENELRKCKIAPTFKEKPISVKLILIEKTINTANKDYFPVVNDKEDMMVFNSSQKFYEAISLTKKTKNRWSSPQRINFAIGSDGNQFMSSMSADGRFILLRKHENDNSDIYIAEFIKNRVTESMPIKEINTRDQERNACISKDGNTIYFSSNRKGTLGGMDIFKCQRISNKKWGKAENLGMNINTMFQEDCPILTENGKRLYFISQGHQGMGGFDIFYSDLDSVSGKWQAPVNIGYPINTADDELFFHPIQNGKIAYFSRIVKDGFGDEDIMRAEFVENSTETTTQLTK